MCPNDRLLLVCRNQLDNREPEADADVLAICQYHPDLVIRPAPALSRTVNVPGALHLEMRVERDVAFDPRQQMLSEAGHLQHPAPDEIRRRVLRHPEVGTHQRLAGQRLIQASPGQPYRVPFWHPSMVPPARSMRDSVARKCFAKLARARFIPSCVTRGGSV